jgi:effector-binding domain-containing protein
MRLSRKCSFEPVSCPKEVNVAERLIKNPKKERAMLKSCRLFLLVLVSGLLVFAYGGCEKKAQEKKVEERKAYQILTKAVDKMTIVYMEHVGPYDQLGPLFGQVAAYGGQKGLELNMVGLYYDDPAVVPAESLRCELGIQLKEAIEPDSGYLVKEIPSHRVVYAVMRGPYDEIAMEYPNIMKWMEEKGLRMAGPITEIYLEAGADCPPEELVTEVRFPVEQ